MERNGIIRFSIDAEKCGVPTTQSGPSRSPKKHCVPFPDLKEIIAGCYEDPGQEKIEPLAGDETASTRSFGQGPIRYHWSNQWFALFSYSG